MRNPPRAEVSPVRRVLARRSEVGRRTLSLVGTRRSPGRSEVKGVRSLMATLCRSSRDLRPTRPLTRLNSRLLVRTSLAA